jgi:hypothetical protein
MSFKQFLVEKELDGKQSTEETQFQTIIDFFVKNKTVNDSNIDSLASELNVDKIELNSIIYKLFSSFFGDGLRNKKSVPDVDKDILNKAIDIEMEHTNNPIIAKLIALDHIAEHGQEYYPALIEMEKTLEKE